MGYTQQQPANKNHHQKPATRQRQKIRHTLEITERAGAITFWELREGERLLGFFGKEDTANHRLEDYGDTRRIRQGKVVETGE